jgi:S1-C subfamily serine protease
MVVNISTSQTLRRPGAQQNDTPAPPAPQGGPNDDFFRNFLDRDNRPRRVQSLGSGFIIDPAGYVVTNNHVIDGADEITVILADTTSLTATLVGKDDKTDLALFGSLCDPAVVRHSVEINIDPLIEHVRSLAELRGICRSSETALSTSSAPGATRTSPPRRR